MKLLLHFCDPSEFFALRISFFSRVLTINQELLTSKVFFKCNNHDDKFFNALPILLVAFDHTFNNYNEIQRLFQRYIGSTHFRIFYSKSNLDPDSIYPI